MSNKTKIISLIGVSIFVLLSVVFFFFDLDISKMLVTDSPNVAWLILAAIGEFPIYIGPILFGLVYCITSNEKRLKLISGMVGLVGMYIACVRLTNGIFEEFFHSNLVTIQYLLLAIVALIIYVLVLQLFNKIDKEKLNKIRDIALLYFIVSISSFVIVTSLKNLWGRTRFYALGYDYEGYSNFLTINGFTSGIEGDDYRSFPSGHTNAATSILILSLIPMRFSDKKWIKYLISGLCVGYVLCVAISRICVGAHYASDVLFGFGISFSCYLITYLIFKKGGWLYVGNNKC